MVRSVAAPSGVVPLTARLVLHVQPRARTSEVAGRHGGVIKVRVAAPPVDDAANAELTRFLAERLGVPRSALRIARGAKARRKVVVVEGLASEAAARLLSGMAP